MISVHQNEFLVQRRQRLTIGISIPRFTKNIEIPAPRFTENEFKLTSVKDIKLIINPLIIENIQQTRITSELHNRV